jgi:adenylate cyclase
MSGLIKHLPRMLVTFLPVLVVLAHVLGWARLTVLDRIDDLFYDARLRMTMPQTLDPRIVIVDVDEKSLAEVGRWPWSRNTLAQVVDELFVRQGVGVLGFDVVFAEPDESSGLKVLEGLAQRELQAVPEFTQRMDGLRKTLDHDRLFAESLSGRPVVMGYYFTSDRGAQVHGQLPTPVMDVAALRGQKVSFTSWNGYGSNLPLLARAAPVAGFFNSITDEDGVVRAVPMLAEHAGAHFESLSLAMFRQMLGVSTVEPGFPPGRFLPRGYQGIESVLVRQTDSALAIPVDHRVASLVPFRGWGGPQGGSFRYVSASDVLKGRLKARDLEGKIALFGTTAPGLLDLRVTPVGPAYPGVEAHANLISGLLDGRMLVKPDYALGYELVLVVLVGLALTVVLPLVTAFRAMALSLVVLSAVTGLNFWLYLGSGLVLPLAACVFMILTAFGLNMSYGYFVESRSKRELAQLFGTYVPPELVDEMVKDPDSYSMQAEARELTVMFCDMKGFTRLSESMEPAQLQALLNRIFSRLTQVIRNHKGTIDKYMGDCVMAFWGAPVHEPRHAAMAVDAAVEMLRVLEDINLEHRQKGLPEVGVGVGLNTGPMFVGDMGSDIRRSYTVIGDAVNLGSRLEALTRVYGVDVVVGEETRKQIQGRLWLELDRVQVKGKQEPVTIYTPVGSEGEDAVKQELMLWGRFLKAYRDQDWEGCDLHLLNLQRMAPPRNLYTLYSQRLAELRNMPFDPAWDGVTRFETK